MGEKRRRHFPNHAPKKVVKQVKAVFRPKKTRRQPHRFRHLQRLFSGHFEKLSVFSRPALSRRLGKYHPPHHGPRHTLSTNGSAGHSCRWIDSPDQNSNGYRCLNSKYRFQPFYQLQKDPLKKLPNDFFKNLIFWSWWILRGTLLNLGTLCKGVNQRLFISKLT